MTKFSLPMTQLIHENLSIVMNFAFSRIPLEQLMDTKFQGEWKYLRKALFEISGRKAEKACLELALFMRLLDDQEYVTNHSKRDFGRLVFRDKPETELNLRHVCNKIIHASDLKWDFATEGNPVLICNSLESEKWLRAEVDIVSLAAFCGELMS